jgi:PAS domain S-box-containing protein
MFGSSPERMAGKSLLDLVILPPVRGNYPNGVAEYFAEGQGAMLGKRTEISAFRSDGSEFPAEMAITRIELDGPPLFTSYIRDLSERRRAEAVQRLLAAIVESSEDAIIGQALDGTILSWNSGAAKIYGYPAEKMTGRSISLLVPKHRPAELPQIYEKIKQGEDIARLETVRVRKDGLLIDVSLTVSPIKDASGKVIGASSIERDITERKRVEAERLNLIQELTEALAKIKTLKGLLPICASCKKIRDDRGYWEKVELYISKHTEAEFTHGICPDCLQRLYPEYSLNPKNHADAQG